MNWKLEILSIDGNEMEYVLGILEDQGAFSRGVGQIIDSTTAQINLDGFSINLLWSDPENIFISTQGEILRKDIGIIASITTNQTYTRAYEFNQW